MTMTDPVADMLTRLRNANSAHHETVTLPSSKLKTHIAEILKQEGYIAAWAVEPARVGENLTLTLKYGPNRERSIAGIKRVSKPGLRVYARSTEIPTVLGGLGVATFMPKLYDDAARLPGRRGAGLGAMTAGVRSAYLVTPAAVGWLAGTGLSVGEAIAGFTLPAMVGLAVVAEANERLLRRARDG